MCSDEACSTYNISKPLMALFSQWSGKTADFDDDDISILSLIVSLDEIGFSKEEITEYLNLRGNNDIKLSILNERRDKLLRAIHQEELQLEKLDYLRFCLQKKEENV